MRIRISNVIINEFSNSSGITVTFEVYGNTDYFIKREFTSRYSCKLGKIPYGIAIIPFVCNVLPIVWLTDGVLICDELDRDFYYSINDIKRGYHEVHPNLFFGGKVISKAVEYVPEEPILESLTFFSGGVDAFATLLSHLEEKPLLFTLYGSDIRLDNQEGMDTLSKQIENVCENFSLSAIQCHSNFRDFIDEHRLCRMVEELGAKDDWWHGFQHGIGLIGHSAPLAFKYGISNIYIASSYSIKDRESITCASDPRIDNYVRFCRTHVIHDQFTLNRQEKISVIVRYCREHNKKVYLRSCWVDLSGKNCCHCEKCYRTAAGLLTEEAKLSDYGFGSINLRRMKFDLKYKILIPRLSIQYWRDIQQSIRQKENSVNGIEWLRTYNIELLHNNPIKRGISRIREVKRWVKRALR